MACSDIALRRRLVDTSLAARLPPEMLHCIREIPVLWRQPGLLEQHAQQPSSRADKRPPLPVLFVAWLLADQHDLRPRTPFACHALRGVLPQRAAAARIDFGL